MRPGLKCNSLLSSVGMFDYAGAEGIFSVRMGKAAEPKTEVFIKLHRNVWIVQKLVNVFFFNNLFNDVLQVCLIKM